MTGRRAVVIERLRSLQNEDCVVCKMKRQCCMVAVAVSILADMPIRTVAFGDIYR